MLIDLSDPEAVFRATHKNTIARVGFITEARLSIELWISTSNELDKNGLHRLARHFPHYIDDQPIYHTENYLCL